MTAVHLSCIINSKIIALNTYITVSSLKRNLRIKTLVIIRSKTGTSVIGYGLKQLTGLIVFCDINCFLDVSVPEFALPDTT